MYKVIIGVDFKAHNEHDMVCGGGYFDCPHCGERIYNPSPKEGCDDSCYNCNNEFMYSHAQD